MEPASKFIYGRTTVQEDAVPFPVQIAINHGVQHAVNFLLLNSDHENKLMAPTFVILGACI